MHLCSLVFIAFGAAASAFVIPQQPSTTSSVRPRLIRSPDRRRPQTSVQLLDNSLSLSLSEGLNQWLKSREACPPEICVENRLLESLRSMEMPPFVIHWFHGINMGIVAAAMGGYGAYLGWQIRNTRKAAAQGQVATSDSPVDWDFEPDNAEMDPMNSKSLHPKLMAGMLLFFFLGAQGGVGAMLLEKQPILESSHALTGLSVLGLLAVQALLSTQFAGADERTRELLKAAHAFLGSATMAVIVAHAVLGVSLGRSFDDAGYIKSLPGYESALADVGAAVL
ncbi:unnamed protein product [Vitrella brassicaformis CCMP3155]|uniref:Uncharacterized protein n=2 Tax=Vitrella brassicaformis TaxID=1169539 RepID=A0A0G4EAJ5_VITBC|nr:unnamed protein product [Vitrella brassicaformis CCMP3155]|eukprot:CEL92283.1 unnamed protein product [Vitrella brassicaformis CCMP3155]